ncbi:ABC transporter ATP-binding protein [Brachybacterium sp. GPGPB12]|uniref:ABC transporter ATP-binding protein n=1 Tax=Brachybacterium sp. GPGPB12 TaxID=3023517 RepID=UPI003134309D
MTAAPASRTSSELGGEAAADEGAIATIRRGLALTPELLRGLWITLLLAVVATGGKVVVPIAVQAILDRGIIAPETPDVAFVAGAAALAALVLLTTAACNVLMNRRLFRLAETSLATLRKRAFRHIHDLSLLTQGTERRGALVSRVTSDVDTVSQFMSFGGIMLVVMSFQLVLATAVMAFYSWPLALVVWLCYLPILVIMGSLQKRIRARYQVVRTKVGEMLGTVSESLVGSATVRAYGTEERTRQAQVRRIGAVRDAQFAVSCAPSPRPSSSRRRPTGSRPPSWSWPGWCSAPARSGSTCPAPTSPPAAWSPSSSSSPCSASPSAWASRCSRRRRTRWPAGDACSACSTPRPTSPIPAAPSTPAPAGAANPSPARRRCPTGRSTSRSASALPLPDRPRGHPRPGRHHPRPLPHRGRGGDRRRQDHLRQVRSPA